MPFINIPSYGSASWKDPVADPASLPASGNELGDARVTESTSEIYVWDGSAWQNVGGSSLPAFDDDKVLYSTSTAAEWRTVGTGSTTAAYPTDTVIVGRAKPSSLTGVDNILIGTTAGTALTNQTRLIAIGKGALDSMSGTSDPGQIAIGYDALTAVVNPTTGGLGNGAGSHVAIGYRAGVNVTGGRASVYIGDTAGGGVTTGGQNVMVGPFAGNGNANQSIFIGYCAGRNATGSYNTVIGGNLNAGAIGSGSSNVGLGYSVFVTNLSTPGGVALTSGSNNTFLGSGSTSLSATQSNSIALGYQCVTGANEFSVGSSNAQINTMLLGRGGASQTVANAVKIMTMRPDATADRDLSVGSLTLAGSQSNGGSAGGEVIIATSPAGTPGGTTANPHVERLKVTAAGETQFLGSTSGYVGVSSPAAPTSYSMVLPSAQGGAGTFLENDGSGNLSWGSAASYPAFSDDQVLYSTTSGVEWRTVGTGSTTAAYPADTVIVGRAKPASLTGINNTLICSGAGNALQTNTNITAIGKDALLSMTGTAGNFYVAIGNEALKSVTTISDATAHGAVAIGYQALVNATDIRKVTAIGYQASRASGERNTVIGWQARFNSTGSFNVIIGDTAGSAGTVSQAVLIGTNCNLTGTGNIAIGESAGSAGAGTGTILIGAGTTVSGSTTGGIALGRSSQVASNEFAVGSASYQINTMLLGRGGASQTTANAVKIQTMRGTGTDRDMSVGTLTIAGAQGTGTGPGGDVIIATAAPALTSGSTLNNHVEVMRITDTGLVGIQTSTPNDPLTVQGSINYTNGTSDYKISPTHHDHGTETTNFTINWSTSPVQTVTLNGTTNAAVTLQNAVQGGAYVLRVIQGATPGTIDFTAGDFANAVWPGGTPPTLSSTTGDVDLINLLYIDDGGGTVTYYGTFAADFS